jgi:hypothetical protein
MQVPVGDVGTTYQGSLGRYQKIIARVLEVGCERFSKSSEC